MVLIPSYPLTDWNFNDSLVPFENDNVLFNNLIGTSFGISDSVIYEMAFARNIRTTISIVTAYVKIAFARKVNTDMNTTDVLKYRNGRGVVTRFSKIYNGWNKNQDSPTPLYGVR